MREIHGGGEGLRCSHLWRPRVQRILRKFRLIGRRDAHPGLVYGGVGVQVLPKRPAKPGGSRVLVWGRCQDVLLLEGRWGRW